MTSSDVRDVTSLGSPSLHGSRHPDWRVLREAVLASLTESPKAFIASADELAGKPAKYWRQRLRGSSWAVVERGDRTLGVAAAKPPGELDDNAQLGEACFIESVWVDPDLRGNGVARRLVTYLIEQQRQEGIRDFYLWVLDHNDPAVRLYKRMEFEQTDRRSELPETQFLRRFDRDVTDGERRENLDGREADKRALGISYRMLGGQPALRHLPLLGWSPGR